MSLLVIGINTNISFKCPGQINASQNTPIFFIVNLLMNTGFLFQKYKERFLDNDFIRKTHDSLRRFIDLQVKHNLSNFAQTRF